MGVATLTNRGDRVLGLLRPILGRMAPNAAFNLPGDISDNSRILVIDSGDLTEILFFAPVLRFLKKRYPGMRVTFLVREGNSELVRTMAEVNEMLTYEESHLTLSSTAYYTLAKRVRSKDFNIAFLLGSCFDMARSGLALATGAPIRIGFTSDRTYPFVNCEVRPASRSSYEGYRVRAFLTILGVNNYDGLPAWHLSPSDKRWGTQQVHFHKPNKDKKLIAIDPGMGKGEHRLTDDATIYLAEQAAARLDAKVLVLSNNLTAKRLVQFRERMSASLLGVEPKNVKEGLALLSKADLLLSGNTDYFHFAVNMRVPTVGLFTRHDTPNWFPKGTPWVQILQGVKGQRISLDEFNSKIDTLLHLARVE